MSRGDAARLLNQILIEAESVSASELAERAGVSRQAAHRLLRDRVRAGTLFVRGRARATRYYRAPGGGDQPVGAPSAAAPSRSEGPKAARTLFSARYPTAGLAEDAVWNAVECSDALRGASEIVVDILHYALTELVNNAIDHAAGSSVAVTITGPPEQFVLEVIDDGIGVFEHVRAHFDLPGPLYAIELLHKGKTTTMPDRHSGEGLFFVARAVERFELESSGLAWLVDGTSGDMAIREASPRKGTRARAWVNKATARRLRAVFDAWTDDLSFDRTRTVVHLFEHGVRFVSRSEAKRLLVGLERFREVVVDFTGVSGIGQGFADEIFRVFARRHPEVRLVPTNMNEAVAFMVGRVDRAGRDT